MERCYTELIKRPTFQERFEYLKLDGIVGKETFGFERFLDQRFYHSREWRSVRDFVIVRDEGCDLGLEGFEIYGAVRVHHINPLMREEVREMSPVLIDPENLICVSFDTHNAIHFGDWDLIPNGPVERMRNDTRLW